MSLLVFLILALLANAFFDQVIVNIPSLLTQGLQSLTGFALLALFLALIGWALGD